jgi:hypothetical protein
VLLNEGNTDFGDSDFIGQITGGSAGGGRIGSGLRLVGETGPELISMGSGGGYVHNNSETQSMLAGAGGDSYTTNFNITGPVSLAELRQRASWYNTYGTRFGGTG